jgi:hypothetical protein
MTTPIEDDGLRAMLHHAEISFDDNSYDPDPRKIAAIITELLSLRSSPAMDGAGEPDEDMARHWIDRYAAGIDEEPQMDRIIAALSPRSS